MDKQTLKQIKELKTISQASVEDCKNAIIESNGDFDKALAILEENNKAIAKKRADKETLAGCVASYTHRAKENNPQRGALVQMECETSFVSKRIEFLTMAKNIAVHITNNNPKYINLEDIPKEDWENEISNLLKLLKEDNENNTKDEEELLKMAKEKASKILKKKVLLLQHFVITPHLTVQEYIDGFVGLFRENIKVKYFARFCIKEEEQEEEE